MKKVLFTVFIGICALNLSCDSGETTGDTRFLIISQGATFSGYYIVDGEYKSIDPNDDIKVDGSTFKCEIDLDNPDSITISATGTTETTSIDAYVYDNDKMVEEEHDSVSADGDIASVKVYYEFVTEDDTDDDSTN